MTGGMSASNGTLCIYLSIYLSSVMNGVSSVFAYLPFDRVMNAQYTELNLPTSIHVNGSRHICSRTDS